MAGLWKRVKTLLRPDGKPRVGREFHGISWVNMIVLFVGDGLVMLIGTNNLKFMDEQAGVQTEY